MPVLPFDRSGNRSPMPQNSTESAISKLFRFAQGFHHQIAGWVFLRLGNPLLAQIHYERVAALHGAHFAAHVQLGRTGMLLRKHALPGFLTRHPTTGPSGKPLRRRLVNSARGLSARTRTSDLSARPKQCLLAPRTTSHRTTSHRTQSERSFADPLRSNPPRSILAISTSYPVDFPRDASFSPAWAIVRFQPMHNG